MSTAAERPALAEQTTSAVRTAKLLIDGKFVESKTKEWRDIVNPATQEVRRPRTVRNERRSRCRRGVCRESIPDLAPDAAWRTHARDAQVPGPRAPEHETHCADADRRAREDPARCRRRYLPRPGSRRTCMFDRHAAAGRILGERGGRRGYLHAAPADRRLRRHHAVQFPRDDPALDVPHGDRLRQYLRAEAIGAGSAVDHGTRRTRARSGHSRRAC